MKHILLSLLLTMSSVGYAVPLQVSRQDIKLPTQKMVEKQTFTSPAAANNNLLVNTDTGPTSAAAYTLTSFSAQPDMARNIVITPGSTYTSIAGCQILVTGTNMFGAVISEVFTFHPSESTQEVGNQAFATVTSVAWPASCESGSFAASWSVGVGSKLGIKRCMDSIGHIFFSTLAGSKEATAPTITVGNSVGVNTAVFNGALNGSNTFELFFMQNNVCFP